MNNFSGAPLPFGAWQTNQVGNFNNQPNNQIDNNQPNNNQSINPAQQLFYGYPGSVVGFNPPPQLHNLPRTLVPLVAGFSLGQRGVVPLVLMPPQPQNQVQEFGLMDVGQNGGAYQFRGGQTMQGGHPFPGSRFAMQPTQGRTSNTHTDTQTTNTSKRQKQKRPEGNIQEEEQERPSKRRKTAEKKSVSSAPTVVAEQSTDLDIHQPDVPQSVLSFLEKWGIQNKASRERNLRDIELLNLLKTVTSLDITARPITNWQMNMLMRVLPQAGLVKLHLRIDKSTQLQFAHFCDNFISKTSVLTDLKIVGTVRRKGEDAFHLVRAIQKNCSLQKVDVTEFYDGPEADEWWRYLSHQETVTLIDKQVQTNLRLAKLHHSPLVPGWNEECLNALCFGISAGKFEKAEKEAIKLFCEKKIVSQDRTLVGLVHWLRTNENVVHPKGADVEQLLDEVVKGATHFYWGSTFTGERKDYDSDLRFILTNAQNIQVIDLDRDSPDWVKDGVKRYLPDLMGAILEHASTKDQLRHLVVANENRLGRIPWDLLWTLLKKHTQLSSLHLKIDFSYTDSLTLDQLFKELTRYPDLQELTLPSVANLGTSDVTQMLGIIEKNQLKRLALPNFCAINFSNPKTFRETQAIAKEADLVRLMDGLVGKDNTSLNSVDIYFPYVNDATNTALMNLIKNNRRLTTLNLKFPDNQMSNVPEIVKEIMSELPHHFTFSRFSIDIHDKTNSTEDKQASAEAEKTKRDAKIAELTERNGEIQAFDNRLTVPLKANNAVARLVIEIDLCFKANNQQLPWELNIEIVGYLVRVAKLDKNKEVVPLGWRSAKSLVLPSKKSS